jgi:hypothetical protein
MLGWDQVSKEVSRPWEVRGKGRGKGQGKKKLSRTWAEAFPGEGGLGALLPESHTLLNLSSYLLQWWLFNSVGLSPG